MDETSYISSVESIGLKATWDQICFDVLQSSENNAIQVDNFGDFYEAGLAASDKNAKKESGQYYTPHDVAMVMAQWFDSVPGDSICDVACGTGNLILAYLEYIGRERSVDLLEKGKIHLYDMDSVALQICVTTIAVRYGKQFQSKINVHYGDFLSREIALPERSKVISNPPYSTFSSIRPEWQQTSTLLSTKELYAAFMEKILLQSEGSVIITPYSFIGGNKFYPLRCVMNKYNGFVVSFDNVPGNIFCGRKHGIFNSNTSNAVRAAITVVQNYAECKGFRFSHLIRFKAIEREKLIQCETLENTVGKTYQQVDQHNNMFSKCDVRLEQLFLRWKEISTLPLGGYIRPYGRFEVHIPNTCRYFTVASAKQLTRKGQISFRLDDEMLFYYIFCMINSSFAYWWWRIYDGGITYPQRLLYQLPLFFDKLSEADKQFFKDVATEMIAHADEFIVTKNNVGIQENIKYPRSYRDRINQRILSILCFDMQEQTLDIIHSNMAMEVGLCEEKSL